MQSKYPVAVEPRHMYKTKYNLASKQPPWKPRHRNYPEYSRKGSGALTSLWRILHRQAPLTFSERCNEVV